MAGKIFDPHDVLFEMEHIEDVVTGGAATREETSMEIVHVLEAPTPFESLSQENWETK